MYVKQLPDYFHFLFVINSIIYLLNEAQSEIKFLRVLDPCTQSKESNLNHQSQSKNVSKTELKVVQFHFHSI